jgi:OOP family OmpA-OmpF porin
MSDKTPANGGGSAGQELAELRGLLVGPEQAQIEALRERLENPALLAEAVSRVLSEAIRLRAGRDASLRSSLSPIIEEAISRSVRRNPAILSDALFPVIGSAVRKAVAAALQGMMESLNRVLEQSLSIRGLRWRIEALRTGKSFGEILVLRSLLYRVEQVFLIHRKTGLLLNHRAAEARVIQDTDLISGMLTGIQDFVSDSFGAQAGQELETMQVGDFNIWVQYSPQALLAGVVRGIAPKELKSVFQEALERICQEQAAELDRFDGDATPFQRSSRYLESCLLGQLPPKARSRPRLLWAVGGVVLLMVSTVWVGTWYRGHRRWNHFLEQLSEQPGIVVTAAGKRGGSYYVAGLRDPLAADPAALLPGAGIEAARVRFRWEPYLSDQPKFVAARRMQAAKAAVERLAVRFATDSAELSAAQIDVITQMAGEMRALLEAARIVGTPVRVEVIGHTDNSGTEMRNTRLADQRAKRVGAALLEAGVPRERLSMRGVGSSEPVRGGDSAVDKELNRSVSLRMLAGDR